MKDTLICYEGGGYDGCFWEWNFAVWDNTGKFRDLISSGRNGLFSGRCEKGNEETTALDMIKTGEDRAEAYDLADPTEVERFGKTYAYPWVVSVVTKLNDIYRGVDDAPELFVVCSECGERVSVYEAELTSWHGCGGIASTADNLICSECRYANTCRICNEYVEESGLKAGLSGWACSECEESLLTDEHADPRAKEIDEIRKAISKGDKQVRTMKKLLPRRAKEIQKAHDKGRAELFGEAQVYMRELIGKAGY